MRGGLLTPTCCPKKELALASLDAVRPAQLLVLRPPLRLPGFKCVQPGLEALAHPPQHAGEVRVVESNHLRAVAPPRGPRQILPLRSCEVVRGEAQPQVPVHVRRLCRASMPAIHAPGETRMRRCAAIRMRRNGPQNGTLCNGRAFLKRRRVKAVVRNVCL